MHTYQGTLSEDDYVEIAKLQRQLHPGAKTIAEWLLWFGLAFLFMSGWAYLGERKNPSEALFWAALAPPCLLFWRLRRPDPRRLWRSTPALREPHAGQITEQALEARLQGVDTRIPWTAFSSCRASPRALVLHAGQMVIPLAKGLFPNEQEWLAVRAIIVRSVPLPESQVSFGGRALARTLLLWLALLMVILLAWHYAQMPRPR